jgi:hypothetical protein
VEGWGCDRGSLMVHNAGSVTTQNIAFKYVMASEPYGYICYLKQVMAACHTLKLIFKTLITLNVKCFLT